jgi:hypothetical protein
MTTPHRHLYIAALLSLGAGASLTTRAEASPLFETMGPVGSDGAMSPSAAGASAASTYFNPALLIDAEDSALFGFAVLSEQIALTLDGRKGGAEVPLAVAGRDVLGGDGQPISNATVPTQWLDQGCDEGTRKGQCSAPAFGARPRQSRGSSGNTRAYVALGLVRELIHDRLKLGLYGLVPVSRLTTASTFYNDEREALFSNSLHPELYGDRLTAISLSAAAGFKLLDTFSVGIGVSLGLTNAASSATYIRDSSNYDSLLINNQVGVTVAASPQIGVSYKPFSRLRFGGALHAPEAFVIDTTIGATLPSGAQSGATKSEVHDFMPWRASFGVEADVVNRARWGLGLAASAKYGFWSAYLDRHGASPSTYGSDLAWKDTLTWAAGVRPKYGPARGWIDMQYAPSPVPDQIARSNYVDNDRVGMALGTDVTVEVGGARLRPGLSLVGYRLIRRHNTKVDARMIDELPDSAIYAGSREPVPGAAGLQTNNPGWPGFASEGWVYGGTFTLDVLLK